jgi:hypothetical protein
MLTVEVKVNGTLIATIAARNVGQPPGTQDAPGDFLGETHQPRSYTVSVVEREKPGKTFTIQHDRFFGWGGLLHAITREVMTTCVETVTDDDESAAELLGAQARMRMRKAMNEVKLTKLSDGSEVGAIDKDGMLGYVVVNHDEQPRKRKEAKQ